MWVHESFLQSAGLGLSLVNPTPAFYNHHRLEIIRGASSATFRVESRDNHAPIHSRREPASVEPFASSHAVSTTYITLFGDETRNQQDRPPPPPLRSCCLAEP